MSATGRYRAELAGLDEWEPYLLAHSGLPGPRGNLELAAVAAELGDAERFVRWLAYDPDVAPTNTPEEFLAFCGTLGLGRLIAEGDENWWPALRAQASDPRWRTREAAAMALQRLGDADMARMLAAARDWAGGTWLEQRAAAASVAEPRLLQDPEAARGALAVLESITDHMAVAPDRRDPDFRVLRQAMGYCWSVVVASLPDEGKAAMERRMAVADPDIRWVMKENLSKNRLARLDAAWVERWKTALAEPRSA